LHLDRGAGEIAAIEAAFSQIERTAEVARRYGARSVAARVAAARGTLTVGTFGASYRADCLIIGSAIHEATLLVGRASDGELVADDDIARLAEKSADTLRIERLSGAGGAPPARVSRRDR
jgi:hypothetical protein